jgi:hypothetical protein
MIPEAQIALMSASESPHGWRPRPIAIAPNAPIVGIDVGENALDFAIADSGQMRLERVGLAGLENSPGQAIAELARRIVAIVPELTGKGAIALIDSPCYPRNGAAPAKNAAKSSYTRLIDARLAAIVRRIRQARAKSNPSLGLWLFPTPPSAEFVRYACDPSCPSHLVRFVYELFPQYTEKRDAESEKSGAGRIFTRFMISGFALYRALSQWPVACFEGYPDLYFRLCANGASITPKRVGRRRAMETRIPIVTAVMRQSGQTGSAPTTLDQADAAILAASACAARRSGTLLGIEAPSEGVFALPLARADARYLVNSSTPVDFGMINER